VLNEMFKLVQFPAILKYVLVSIQCSFEGSVKKLVVRHTQIRRHIQ